MPEETMTPLRKRLAAIKADVPSSTASQLKKALMALCDLLDEMEQKRITDFRQSITEVK
jgi:hypothetical protein